jgi:alpha-galactosidase
MLALIAWITLAWPLTLRAGTAPHWSLQTDDTVIRFDLVDGRLLISSLRSKKDNHNWIASPMPLSLMENIWLDERAIPLAWRLERVQPAGAEGRLTFCFSNAEPRLALRSIWRARPGHGPVEHWVEIENRSGHEITLSLQDSLALGRLRTGGTATAHWIKRGGGNADTEGGTFVDTVTNGYALTLDSNPTDGASPVPWLAIQAEAGRGLYVGWEFSGLGGIRTTANDGQIEIHVGNHADFKTGLQQGEVFQVPPAFVGCYHGDVDDGSYCLHRFIIEKLRPAPPKNCPDPILAYNLYLDAGGNQAREADVLRCAATCHDLGFELFMPDAMWFPATGDWRWDPARFPQGIKPIEEFVHGAGMRLALWCAWSNGGMSQDKSALNVRRHPDWFHRDYGPDWRPGDFTGGHLCLGCDAAKWWAVEKTHSLVADNKLDYLKHDCDPIMVTCSQTDHRHHFGVDVSYWATMGYYEVQEKLLQTFPSLFLENCSGAGHIKDFGAVKRSHYTATTDTLSNLPDRRSIYDSTFALPPLLLQAYTYDNYYQVRGDNPGTFLWRSGMMGAWQIDPTDTAKWTESEKESARQSVRVYKEWIRPILQDAEVHHILPRPDGLHWDGLFFWSPSLTKGTLYVFRPDAPEDNRVVPLKGLKPRRHYRVWSQDGSIQPGVRTGNELMRTGLAIHLPERYTSDLIFLQDASLGEAGK